MIFYIPTVRNNTVLSLSFCACLCKSDSKIPVLFLQFVRYLILNITSLLLTSHFSSVNITISLSTLKVCYKDEKVLSLRLCRESEHNKMITKRSLYYQQIPQQCIRWYLSPPFHNLSSKR